MIIVIIIIIIFIIVIVAVVNVSNSFALVCWVLTGKCQPTT